MKTNAKLTSIRLDPVVVDAVEKLVNKHSYWKKSQILNALLMAVFLNFTESQIYDMMRSYNWDRREVQTAFEIMDEMCNSKHSKYVKDNGL